MSSRVRPLLAIALLTFGACSPSTPSNPPGATTPAAAASTDPSATGDGTIPVPAPVLEADSSSKIDAAEAVGTIDHDTALVYQVFASLDYADLPVEYQSTNPAASDATTALTELSASLDQLPAALKAKVAPFFLRPDDPDSFWQHRLAPTAAGGITLAAFAAAIPMEFVDADTTPVRVWYATRLGTSERDLAVKLADEIDASGMWDKEKAAMLGHTPCTDNNLTHNGGSSRLDIYLVYPSTGLDFGGRSDPLGFGEPDENGKSWPNNGVNIKDGEGDTVNGVKCPIATHVMVNAGLDFEHLKSTTAHELFHAFQYSFKNAILPDRNWWMEATATWAKDLVYPAQDFEQAYLDSYWSHTTNGAPAGPIDSQLGTAEYGAYILPFYLDQKSGDPSGAVIGQTWAGSETNAPIDVLAALPGWKAKFKEFALWNWNQADVALYRDASRKIPEAKLSQNTTCMDKAIVRHGGAGECIVKAGKLETAIDLDRASVQYYEGVPDWPNVEKFTFDLGDVQSKAGLGLQALLVGDDGAIKVEDWTDLPTKSFCTEHISKVVLAVSNSNVKDGQRVQGRIKLNAEAGGCSGWQGTMTGTYDWHLGDDKGTGTSTFTGIWTVIAPDQAVACRSAPPSPGDCLVYLPNGTIDWTWDVTQQNCSEHQAGQVLAGAVNDPRNAPGGNGIQLGSQSFVLVDDGAGHFGYWGLGAWYIGRNMKCADNVHAGSHPPAYLNLSQSAHGSDGSCDGTTWQIDTAATSISGSCYQWNNSGSSMLSTWNLVKVGNATGP